MVSGGARVPGAAYDYVTLEEGLKQAGLVTVGLLRACLASTVPIVLGGHSFGVGVARLVASCLEMQGLEIRALVAHDLGHMSRSPMEIFKQFAAWTCVMTHVGRFSRSRYKLDVSASFHNADDTSEPTQRVAR